MFTLWKKKEEQHSEERPSIAEQNPIPDDMTLEQVRPAMLQLLSEETANHYRMGQLYNYVADRELAEAAGYDSALEYFRANLPEVSASALFMYGSVARNFSLAPCDQFGITRLSLLLTYKAATNLEVNHAQPGGTSIEVPEKNGKVKSKLFSECSVADMRKAIQRKRTSTSTPVPAADMALADRLLKAVTNSFPKGEPIRVQVRNHQGKAVLDFKGIPLEKVDKLVQALSAQPLPVRAVKEVEQAPHVV